MSDARNRARYQGLGATKNATLARRHKTYLRHAERFNEHFDPNTSIQTPSCANVRRMDIADPFWEIADLDNPGEDRAVDPNTRSGIDAWRTQRSSQEEMRRIGREVRQLLLWADAYATKVTELERTGKW